MKSSLPIIIVVIVLIVGIGYLATQDKSTKQASVATTDTEERVEGDQLPVTNEPEVTPAEVSTSEVDTAGAYLPYSAEAVAQSDADRILLFFHAAWCPSCKALDADIVKNADSIPSGVAIYKVDYDTSTALKRKYGVTTQHSIIEINKDGEALSSISHPLTLDGVVATVQ